MILLREIYTEDQVKLAAYHDDGGPHHPIGGSSYYRGLKCPGSVLAGKIDGIERESTEASEGTRIHAEIQQAIMGIGEASSKHSQRALAFLETLYSRGWRLMGTECPVRMIDPDTGEVLSYSRTDAILVNDDNRALILDWKTGAGWETCHKSQIGQGRHYIADFLSEFPQYKDCAFMCFETEENEIGQTILALDREWANGFIREFRKLLELCLSGDAPFADCTGDYCQYCRVKAAGKCPVMVREAREAADNIGLEIPEGTALMSLEDADRLLRNAKTVIKACEQIEENAKAAIIAAGGSPGYMVCQVKGRTKTDWDAVAIAANIPPCIIEQNTTTGKPTVMVRERKK